MASYYRRHRPYGSPEDVSLVQAVQGILYLGASVSSSPGPSLDAEPLESTVDRESPVPEPLGDLRDAPLLLEIEPFEQLFLVLVPKRLGYLIPVFVHLALLLQNVYVLNAIVDLFDTPALL